MSDTAGARATIEQCLDLAELLEYPCPDDFDRLRAALAALRAVVARQQAVVAAAEAYHAACVATEVAYDGGALGWGERVSDAFVARNAASDALRTAIAARQRAAPAAGEGEDG